MGTPPVSRGGYRWVAWTLFQPWGGRGSVHWAEWFGIGLPVNMGPPPLSCPWRLVFQHSPFQGPGRGYSQELNHKPNQRSNTSYSEIHKTALTSLLSLVPRYWLAVREQTGTLGSPGVVCPMSEVGRLILEALFSCYWTTPRPHLYKRQKPWYILNLWEDLLASSWHNALFLSLTVSGTRSDSLLKLKVPLRTSILTTSVGLILPMLICKMEMNMYLIELSWELHEIISVKHLELCLALSKPLITFTTIIVVALHGWEGWDPERWNTLPEVTQMRSTPPYPPQKKEAELELESKSTTLCWRQLFFWHLWSTCNWELRFMCP